MPDDVDRDKLYSAESEEDDLEYEVEPPDADVLAAEARRAEEAVAAIEESAIDVDEIYRDLDNRRDEEILRDWLGRFPRRFQIKHMLIATAVVAILLTLERFGLLGTFFVLAIMGGVVGVTLYLQWQEKRRQDELDRQRRERYAQRRARLRSQAAAAGGAAAEPAVEPSGASAAVPAAGPPPDELDAVRQQAAGPTFAFRFSLRQLLVAITAAAVILALVNLLGGPHNAATTLGFVALAGLVVHALGYEPPEIVAFGWWVLLVFYIGMSLFAVVFGGLAG